MERDGKGGRERGRREKGGRESGGRKGEGGETEFLDALEEDETRGDDGEEAEEVKVLFGARPVRGSILLFPHDIPHRGNCVGMCPKILLRGDLY